MPKGKFENLEEPTTQEQADRFVGSRIYKLFEDGNYYEGFVTEAWPDEEVEEVRFNFSIYYPIDQGREDIDLQELKLWMTTLGPSQAGNRAATQVKRERPDRDPSTALKPPPAAKKAKDNVGVPNAARRSSVPVAPAAKRRRRTQRGGKGDDNNDDDEEEEEEEEDDDSMVENEDPDDGGMPSRAASRPTAPSAPKGGASKAQGEGRGSKGGSRAKGPATNAYEVPEGEPSTTEGLRTHGLAGHLMSIHMEDFMCHRHFEMEFGPHVTLVSGENGSGKSAVLQGLQACLGVHARATGRATNLQSFIRTGSDVARVRVTLNNTGEDAFERSRLGSKISLEKKLVRAAGGGTTWKVLDERGKVVNDIKPKAVLEHLGVDAANPLTIVTQDGVRSFFSGDLADRKRKYQMFMEGTLLENIRSDLADSSSTLDKMHDILLGIKQTLRVKKDELKLLKEKIEKLKGVDELSAGMEAMSKCLGWVCVWQAREELEELRRGGGGEGEEGEERERVEDKVKRVQERVVAATEALERAIKEEKDQVDAMKASNESVAAATADQAKLNQQYKDVATNRRRIEIEVKKLEALLKDFESSKSELEKVQAEDLTDKARERRVLMEKMERQVNQAREAVRTADVQFDARRSATLVARAERERLTRERESCYRDQETCKRQGEGYRRQLMEIETSQTDRARLFAPARSQNADCVRRLLELVGRNRGRFERQPLGPTGLYLGLKDSSFSATRMNFDNDKPYDVSRNRLPHGVTSIMDVLVVSAPQSSALSSADKTKAETLILNFLIDKARVEANALYEDQHLARDAVYGTLNNRGQGQGVRNAFVMDGHSFGINGSTLMSKPYNGRRAPRVGLDNAQQVSQINEALRSCEGQIRTAADRLSSIRADEIEADRKLGLACQEEQEAGKGKKIAKMAYDEAVRDLQRVQEEAQQQAQSRSRSRSKAGPSSSQHHSHEEEEDELATQVDKFRTDILTTQVELDDYRARLEAAKAGEKEVKSLLDQRKELIARSYSSVEGHEKKVQEAVALRARAESAVKKEKARLETIRSELAKREQEVDAKRKEVAELAKVASELVPDESEAKRALVHVQEYFRRYLRPLVAERARAGHASVPKFNNEEEMEAFVDEKAQEKCTAENLSKEIERVERKIKSAENDAGGDKDDLERRHDKLYKEYTKIDIKFKAGVDIYKAMEKSLEYRKQGYARLHKATVGITSDDFHRYMKRRQHLGRVVVEEELGELTIEVKVKGLVDKDAKAVRDLKQLSGGERSYTATSYLLAVGRHTESPFRCMDEYDVFMDAINRRVATETLLEFAHEYPAKQYVFLTPQDIQAVEDARRELVKKRQGAGEKTFELPDSFLKVVRMQAARQGQA